jgi:Flp pilus assembly protein TadD
MTMKREERISLVATHARDYASISFPKLFMAPAQWRVAKRIARDFLPLVLLLFSVAIPGMGQDSSSEGPMMRGDRPEIAVTVRDSSGQPISTAASVRLTREGMPVDQGATSHGRVFFILRDLGSYTVIVEAAGYKTAQKDVNLTVAMKSEIDVSLQPESSSGDSAGPSKPVLAPKAREALMKGLHAITANKPDEADKDIAEAMKLAPGHPDVLFGQGVLFLSRKDWPQAQLSLEKCTQIDSGNARAFSALGMVLSNQGKYEEAIRPLEKAVQLEPSGWETRSTLADAYYRHEQYEEALKASQQALTDSAGKGPQIQLLVAQSLTAVGRYEDSAQALRDFLKNYGDRPEAGRARRWLDKMARDGKIRTE